MSDMIVISTRASGQGNKARQAVKALDNIKGLNMNNGKNWLDSLEYNEDNEKMSIGDIIGGILFVAFIYITSVALCVIFG